MHEIQPPIQKLPEVVSNQIAAGEVVERPSNVVKELVENSLDAGATEIEVHLTLGGKEKIEVIDNGSGIPKLELPLSIQRYATSKIRTADELFSLNSYGFRGEALPSIASVSRFTMQSKTRGEKAGAEIIQEGNSKIKVNPYSGNLGTRTLVEDLFFNVPARLKFLKTPGTERGKILQALKSMAMVRPEVSFRLISDDKELFFFPKCKNQVDRIMDVMGWGNLIENQDYFMVDRSAYGMHLQGLFLKSPVKTSKSRNIQIFINGRIVRDRMVHQAVVNAYRTFLMDHETPGYVLFLNLEGDLVDVNVHPAKTEVRFSKSGDVFGFVTATLKKTLESNFTQAYRSPYFDPKNQKAEKQENLIPQSTIQYKALPAFDSTGMRYSKPIEFNQAKSKAGEITRPQIDIKTNARSENNIENHVEFQPDKGPENNPKGNDYFKSLAIIGTCFQTYILCQGKTGLVMIDQHAAHERITFNKLKVQFLKGEIKKRKFLLTESLSAPQELVALLEDDEIQKKLSELGFSVEPFGSDSLRVLEIPELLVEKNYFQLILDTLEDFSQSKPSEVIQEKIDHLLATMACHGSVRAGQALSPNQIQSLLNELDELGHSPNCPHGRPAAIELTQLELETLFKRNQ